jgi:DNA-nicking Smr family endonuclease
MRDWSLPLLDVIQNMSEPIPLPVDGVLDLHTFRPQDVKEVVTEYLAACREKDIFEVRVIHGKGIGQLRQTVHALLRKRPEVISFDLAGEAYGGAGATFVRLRPPTRSSSPSP